MNCANCGISNVIIRENVPSGKPSSIIMSVGSITGINKSIPSPIIWILTTIGPSGIINDIIISVFNSSTSNSTANIVVGTSKSGTIICVSSQPISFVGDGVGPFVGYGVGELVGYGVGPFVG